MAATKLIIPGLSSLDEEELRELLGDQVTFQEPEVPEGSLAEPTTIIAVIVLGSIALNGLAAYLSKGRRRYVQRQTFRVVHPDGRVEERKLEIEASSEDEVKAEILAELSKWAPAVGDLNTP